MVENDLLHKEITDLIINAFYKVYNELGFGFLEKVYENAMVVELNSIGLKFQQQVCMKVYYKGQVVGFYIADLLVESKIIVELKAAESIAFEHECQLINYLKASEVSVGLLLNFGKKPSFKRKIFTNFK